MVKVTFSFKMASSQVSFYHKTDVSGPISCKALRARYGLQCVDHVGIRMLYNRLTRTYDASVTFGDLPDPAHLCKRFLQHRYCYAQTCFKVHLDPSQQVQADMDEAGEQVSEGSGEAEEEGAVTSSSTSDLEDVEGMEDLEASADEGSSDRSGGEAEVRCKQRTGPVHQDGQPTVSDDEASSEGDADDACRSFAPVGVAKRFCGNSPTLTQPPPRGDRSSLIRSFWAAGCAPPPGGWASGRGKGTGRGKGKGRR
eukprot:GGOE01036825.1.p1 GENE.GGOE01036825.1~~GGOE01036825.1.p1  ORF type:complete len:293 (-),score=44.26 GGOE01036825.1:177-938(-)